MNATLMQMQSAHRAVGARMAHIAREFYPFGDAPECYLAAVESAVADNIARAVAAVGGSRVDLLLGCAIVGGEFRKRYTQLTEKRKAQPWGMKRTTDNV